MNEKVTAKLAADTRGLSLSRQMPFRPRTAVLLMLPINGAADRIRLDLPTLS